jgi:O-antigen ligase/DNA-binding SARP family transcriptional activator
MVLILFIGGSPYYNAVFAVRVGYHAFITALFGGWLIARLVRGRGLPRTPLDPLLAAIAVWWAVTAVFSLNPRVAFETLWFPLGHLLMFWWVADTIARGRGRIVMELYFFACALVAILAGLQAWAWAFGSAWLPGTEVGWLSVAGEVGFRLPRLYLPLGVTTWLAAFTAPAALLSAVWAFTTPRRDVRVALGALAAVLVVVLVATDSRGGLLAFAVALGVFGLLVAVGSGRVRPVVAGVGAAGLAAAIAVVLVVYNGVAGRGGSDALRLGLWNSAVRLIAEDPLTGTGPGLFAHGERLIREGGYYDDRLSTAHNALLNTAAETGIVGVGLLVAAAGFVAWRWWARWRSAAGVPRLRLAAMFAVLVGFAAQSMVDLFTSTPLVVFMLGAVAWCTVEPRSLAVQRAETPRAPDRARIAGAAVLVVLAAYAIAFFGWDRAHAAHLAGLSAPTPAAAREAAVRAHTLDPALNLYLLQIAYLNGREAASADAIAAAIAEHTAVLALEPTWETGWLNLAALYLRAGEPGAAAEAAARALPLGYLGDAPFWAARLSEQAGAPLDAAAQTDAYAIALSNDLPFARFWTETAVRRAAVERAFARYPVDGQYRALVEHDPARAAALVPADPVTGPDWWALGEAAYRADDGAAAEAAFTRAIGLRASGDDYAARARAVARYRPDDRAAVLRDLAVARFLGAQFENVPALRARYADDAAVRVRLLIEAGGQRVISQNFEGVLYLGRVASFEPYPEVVFHNTSPERAAPLLVLADAYAAAGDSAAAQGVIAVYRAWLESAGWPVSPDVGAG